MTKKELEDYLWGAANILRGMIDAADFKQCRPKSRRITVNSKNQQKQH